MFFLTFRFDKTTVSLLLFHLLGKKKKKDILTTGSKLSDTVLVSAVPVLPDCAAHTTSQQEAKKAASSKWLKAQKFRKT